MSASTFLGPDPTYASLLVQLFHRLEDGRGDTSSRGRCRQALHVLESALERRWLSFRPHRSPGRWLVMLLDVLAPATTPERKIALSTDRFLADLEAAGLPGIAEITSWVLDTKLAERFMIQPQTSRALVPPLALKSALWHVAFEPEAYRLQRRWERHSQGKLLRQKIAQRLDPAWGEALHRLERGGRIDFPTFLAAIPPSFLRIRQLIESTLSHAEDSLRDKPFAVFYALATDAVKGGRIWSPPERYVEAGTYHREDFEQDTGRSLVGSRSRKHRDDPVVTLAELGLSSSFPRTIAVLDTWLERYPFPEFRPGNPHAWLDEADAYVDEIQALTWELYEQVERLLQRKAGN